MPATEPGVEEPQLLVAEDGQELSDEQFTMYLMNEDTVCPGCHRPFVPKDGKPEGGKPEGDMVVPLRLDCQHAICKECAEKFYKKEVAFMDKGCVCCQFEKRDQLGNGPFKCRFMTECDLEEKGYPKLPESEEIQLVCKALRISGVLVGTHHTDITKEGKDGYNFFWFKVCHKCGMPATHVMKDLSTALCDKCFKGDAKAWKVDEYEKEVVRSHKCCKCGNEAIMYCAKCDKYYCKERECYDPCKDPDHVLVTFLPNISEMKREEYQAIESSRKMFLNDVHEYNDPNPFMRRLYDLECFRRALFSLYSIRFKEEEEKKKEKNSAATEDDK